MRDALPSDSHDLVDLNTRSAQSKRMSAIQGSLFGHSPVSFDPDFRAIRRQELSAGAWVDHAPGFLHGHERLLAQLGTTTEWQQEQRAMYDRIVAVPRLVANVPDHSPGHPILTRLRDALSAYYGVELTHTSLALYRDGADSVAWHGDRIARELPQSMVVTLSLGAPRPFRLRPKERSPKTRRRALGWNLGWGDLVVMGGTCQRTWEHAVPKQKHADPRMVVMFRPTWRGADIPTQREPAQRSKSAPEERAA